MTDVFMFAFVFVVGVVVGWFLGLEAIKALPTKDQEKEWSKRWRRPVA